MSIVTGANRDAVADLAASIGAKTIVEIGVRRGRLSLLLFEVPTLERLFLIDCWLEDHLDAQEKMDKNRRGVMRWAKKAKGHKVISVMHMRSDVAVNAFKSGEIDFLYIDGDHSYRGVTQDIVNYLPKIRKGGIIAGDDYVIDSVARAVDKLIPDRKLIPDTRTWWSVVK